MTMTAKRVKIKSGYKHQVDERISFFTAFRPLVELRLPFLTLTIDGELIFDPGYAYDGASGPTIDDEINKHFSLPHDGLYQFMRAGLIDWRLWRKADYEMEKAALARLESATKWQRFTWKVRLPVYMWVLNRAGGKHARVEQAKTVMAV